MHRTVFGLLTGTAIGIALLVVAFFLPVEPMKAHVQQSFLSEAEGAETFTDAIILANAVDEELDKNAFKRAMMVYRKDISDGDWDPEGTLAAIKAGEDLTGSTLRTYSRYWHGYLVLVKPLLLFLTAEKILVLNRVVLGLLWVAIFGVAFWRKTPEVALTITGGMLFLKQAVLTESIAMTICLLIALVAVLIVLLWPEKCKEEQGFWLLFFITGMATAYFDFLTYPILTLGFPLAAALLQELYEDRKGICTCCILAVYWAVGYLGLWGMKWIVADLTLHQGTIKDAAWTIIERTEAIGGRPRMNGLGFTISLNLAEYDATVYQIGALVIFTIGIVGIICMVRTLGAKRAIWNLLPFVILALLPIGWILVAQNHSALHARFTFRIFAVSACAILGIGLRGIALAIGSKRSVVLTDVEKKDN